MHTITLAATVSASSSDIGGVSATVASAESDQITFAVDFTTGAITATEKRLSVNAATTSQSPPSAPVSIHA